ncbi:hypothetical protein L1987_51249 [Smallanthus sonchifolius]|uniref:Uncharacterized protein n=1 Tax=Smallanthus sonchifolius TaxID=185202 RepID=A0ACB9EPR6_9ASTR|nr:hypothetical protein L1987_51249 [Smallanthus sonchifolius]
MSRTEPHPTFIATLIQTPFRTHNAPSQSSLSLCFFYFIHICFQLISIKSLFIIIQTHHEFAPARFGKVFSGVRLE